MQAEREPLYREVADVIVLVDHRSPSEVAEAVLR
jgi:shikimate kinase